MCAGHPAVGHSYFCSSQTDSLKLASTNEPQIQLHSAAVRSLLTLYTPAVLAASCGARYLTVPWYVLPQHYFDAAAALLHGAFWSDICLRLPAAVRSTRRICRETQLSHTTLSPSISDNGPRTEALLSHDAAATCNMTTRSYGRVSWTSHSADVAKL